MRLALFDIDGTLITDGGASREAFAIALEEVYGYRGDVGAYDFSGRTDPQIAHMVLRDADFTEEEVEADLPSLWKRYIGEMESRAEGRVRALPGVQRLIEALRKHRGIVLALLTGNIEPGARIKLAGPGLNDFFPFGAFGSDSSRRVELPPIAVARATAAGHKFTLRDVVIIGDSIYDVRCGIPHAATTIAIASGKTPAERLIAEKPDHCFKNAEDVEGLVEAIVG